MEISSPNRSRCHVLLHRSFHPIGQGAFYTEVFNGPQASIYTVVYDCGTETSSSQMNPDLKTQIAQFKKSLYKKKIDILFISHFHSDHINGLKWLLDDITVEKTVIPMLPESLLTLTKIQNLLKYKKDAIWSNHLIDILYFDRKEPLIDFRNVVCVLPDDSEKISKERLLGNGQSIMNGELIHGLLDLWVYLPFNSIESNDPRATAFLNGLKHIPEIWLKNNQLDYNKLIKGCRVKVKRLYKKVMGGKNDNLYTLVVASLPNSEPLFSSEYRSSRCLYMGDFDSKKNDALWKRLESKITYSEIGTIQVPHHGSMYNWREEMLTDKRTHFIISAGTNNRYNHPDFDILKQIWKTGSCGHIVSERKDSKFIQDY